MLHASYLYVCFINISAYIPIEIPNGLFYTYFKNLFYTNSFIFIFADVNLDVKYAIYSDLVICNNFINYEVLPAFDFYSIGLDPSQLLQTDLTPKRKCCNDYCFRLVLFIFSIMFASMFLRNKHKKVKAFFGCIIFLFTITKLNLSTKNDILKSTSKIFSYESIDACNFLQTSHIYNAFVSLHYQNLSTETKTSSLNCYCYFRVKSV